MSTKTKLKLFIGIIMTAVIIYYSIEALKGLHVSVLFQTDINWGLALVSVAIFGYANYIRGLAYTRGIDRDMDRMTALQIVGIGHASNMVLPFHIGEGLRAAFFPKGYSAIKITNLLIIPAVADFAAIMILSIAAVPFAGFKDQNLLNALWILTFLSIAAFIVFVILIFFHSPLRSYLSDYLNVDTVKMMNWVLLSWVMLLVSTWIGLVAFGFPWVASIRLSLAVFAATNIINFIPATPGAIGLFQYGTILALGGLGIDPTTALSASLLLHLIQYAALLPLGGYLYLRSLHGEYGEALGNLWHRNRQKDRKSLKLKRTK
ncbi:lysylphosphatidylglycerol synthase domain-containing protein [Desulfosporosinus shakirovi]|uniref:lysylphosphatidylglycerol synthase domain-containing protein n=1 Tax=Desulfosporosinus shakirovi TaxID=2885154 RepID=UPI001E4ADCF0|nr:lysylphosphatidylglycerol synthase domain-containing protein [Desulfosporosinus sp. SRJS8]MCB8817688.1 flippase-like domain-containing protein [Desulfosporosinus sp. SRJS8]